MQKLQGYAGVGGETVSITGFSGVSPYTYHKSYPECTVTVYVTDSQSLASGTYVAGGTITGAAGQTVTLTFTNGGTATCALTDVNTIAAGTALTITSAGRGFTAAPVVATLSDGTATATGVATVTTVLTNTIASIYADNALTVKANPFTASTDGSWFFYASNGRYDVRFSGTGIDTAFTLGDFNLFDEYDSFVNVKDARFGAVGDDTTDDTVAIEAAFASLALTGGILYFPPGTYYCPSGLDFSIATNDTTHNWIIRGAGMNASLIHTEDANISLDLGGRNRVTLEDFSIYDSGTSANVGIARYRVVAIAPATNGPGHFHVYRRIQTRGVYAMASLYSIASEVNDHYDCQFYNSGNGAAVYTATTNLLSLTANQTFSGAGDASNTVNNFFGGFMQGAAATTGGALQFGGGICSNFNFFGVYFVGYATGYNVLFRSHQGLVNFDGCRFEGTAHAIQQQDSGASAGTLWGLHVTNCIFGQDNGAVAARDLYWGGTNAGDKLINAYINNNWHFDNDSGIKGIYLSAVTGSYIRIPEYPFYDDNAITVTSNVNGCYLEAPQITLGATSQVIASKLVINSNNDKTYIESYGPNPAYHGVNDPYSSLVVFNRFKSAPAVPADGMIVTAYGSNDSGWDPLTNSQGTGYPTFYDGTRWRPMVPITSDVNSVAQFVYTEANTDEKVLHTLTIAANTLGAAPFKQVLRIRATGRTADNTNAKTIKMKLADSTNTVILVQNTVTAAPQNLAWIIEAEIAMASVYATGYWGYFASLTFNGVAPQMDANLFSAGAEVLGFDEDITLSVTGQNGVASADDISCFTLSWELVHAE